MPLYLHKGQGYLRMDMSDAVLRNLTKSVLRQFYEHGWIVNATDKHSAPSSSITL